MTGTDPRSALAVVLLITFSAPPTDRALDGWSLDECELGESLDDLQLRERIA